MGKILSIDTATDICSVALGIDGELADKLEAIEERSHAKLLTVLVQQIIEKNGLKITDLDAVAVSEGPGSYTGLRIGVSAAKGMCYASKLPLIGVSTLQTIAAAYLANNAISDDVILLPMLDAKRMEVYYAQYNAVLEEKISATPLVVDEKSFQEFSQDTKVVFIGSGAEKCSRVLQLKNAEYIVDMLNKAEFMVHIAEQKFTEKRFVDVAYFEPAYLKPFLATQPKKKFF